MVEKLTYEQIKSFLQDFCEDYKFNEVKKDRVSIGISRQHNEILAVARGVRTNDGTLTIRMCDTELFFSPYFIYKDDLRKGKYIFKDHKIELNKYYVNFMEKTFGKENYDNFCETSDLLEK